MENTTPLCMLFVKPWAAWRAKTKTKGNSKMDSKAGGCRGTEQGQEGDKGVMFAERAACLIGYTGGGSVLPEAKAWTGSNLEKHLSKELL